MARTFTDRAICLVSRCLKIFNLNLNFLRGGKGKKGRREFGMEGGRKEVCIGVRTEKRQ